MMSERWRDLIKEARASVGMHSGRMAYDALKYLAKRIAELEADVARLVADGLEALSEEEMRRLFGDENFDAEAKIGEFVSRHAIAKAKDKATIEKLKGLLRESRRKHLCCEDAWYSCPKTEEGCADGRQGDECNCGADKWNGKIEAALKEESDE